jgi:hypothetical protein
MSRLDFRESLDRKIGGLVVYLLVMLFAEKYEVGILVSFLCGQRIVVSVREELIPGDDVSLVTHNRRVVIWICGIDDQFVLTDGALVA